MSASYLQRIKPFIELLRLDPYAFGYAGEMYLNDDAYQEAHGLFDSLLNKYLTRNSSYVYNRTPWYYSGDFHETVNLLKAVPVDYQIIYKSEIGDKTKRYLLFTLIEYSMAAVAKLLDLGFSYPALQNELYHPLKTYLTDLASLLVDIAYRDALGDMPRAQPELFRLLQQFAENQPLTAVRQYVEMDHKMSLLIGYLLFLDSLDQYDVMIAPLLGGALIPPLFLALTAMTKPDSTGKTQRIDYVKCSYYDEGIKDVPPAEGFLTEQLQVLQTEYGRDVKVLLIDDNIGSGRTLNKVKTVLATHFNVIATGGIEFFWERKLGIEKRNLPSFDMNDFDLVSPLSYRYFRKLDQSIEKLRQPGKSAPNQIINYPMFFPDTVDGLVKFREYLNLQELDAKKKLMLTEMERRIRTIKRCFLMQRER